MLSSHPIDAKTALTSGSAKALLMSAALFAGFALASGEESLVEGISWILNHKFLRCSRPLSKI